ncbi:MAG: hypothetical protein AAF805_09655 [Planctomycetota bacterium]
MGELAAARPEQSRRALGPRFGTNALLLLTTAVAVLMGVWAAVVRPYAEQARAVATLREYGAQIELGPAEPSPWRRAMVTTFAGADAYAKAVTLRWPPDSGALAKSDGLPDGFATMLASMKSLRTVDLDRTDFDDADAAGLAGLTQLEELSLRYTRITDAAIARLARCERLRTLRLTGCRVSDEILSGLAKLPALTEVYARWTDVSACGECTCGEFDGLQVHRTPR